MRIHRSKNRVHKRHFLCYNKEAFESVFFDGTIMKKTGKNETIILEGVIWYGFIDDQRII